MLTSKTVAATPYAKKLAKTHNIDLAQIFTGSVIRGKDVESIIAKKKTATPLAIAIAEKLGVDLMSLKGTGFGGKITKADVLAANAAVGSPKVIPMNTMRSVIARRMSSSQSEIPTVNTCVKIDVTALMEFRRKYNEGKEKAEKISLNDLIVKATGKALQTNERFRMVLSGTNYLLYDAIDIGVAVGLDDGLLVPVVRGVDTKSVGQVSADIKQLADMAKRGKLRPEHMGNARISISNLGMFGTYYFTPIINQPEAAIIGVGGVEDELALVDGQVVVRKKMILSTTYDHRIINGMEASRFQADIKALLENPADIIT